MKERDESTADIDRLLSGEPADSAAALREAWDRISDPVADFPDPQEMDRVWKSVEAVVTSSDPVTFGAMRRPLTGSIKSKWIDHLFTPRRALRLAVAVLALLSVGLAVQLFIGRTVVSTAPAGERLAITLSDGSRVELNSGSVLRRDRTFGSERTVVLEGEAFFDVTRDDRPFVVKTFNARVSVLGTSFNVKAWEDSVDPNTTVVLESGRVMVQSLGDSGSTVQLEPGETVRVRVDSAIDASRDTMAVATAISWRTGDFVYKDELLGVILEDVERRFGIDLLLVSPDLSQRQLTLARRNPIDAEGVVRDICVPLGLNYREMRGGFEIFVPISP